jgi:hypothetical protein
VKQAEAFRLQKEAESIMKEAEALANVRNWERREREREVEGS